MDNRQFFASEANKNRDKWLNSAGASSSSGGKASPFVIRIRNASGSSISNVDIGDSLANRFDSNFGQNAEISVTSLVPGVTYQEWLGYVEEHPFYVLKTEYISSTENQLEEPCQITHRTASGEVQSFILGMDKDPYQSQNNIIADDTRYIFDGFSRFRINSVLASARITIKIWPGELLDPTQTVAKRDPVQKFSSPFWYE